MKYCHLLAALTLAACGLDTGALPATDAGVDAAAHGGGLAGSPATWPVRRRLTPIAHSKDGGAADPKDPANKPGGKQPGTSGTGGASGQGGQTKPTGQAGSAGAGATSPSGQATPGGQAPSNSGKGGQAKPSGPAGSGTSQPSGSNHGSQSSADAGTSMSSNPGSNGSHGNPGNGGQGPTSGPGSSGSGNGPQASSPVGGTISGIVDLVLAILDLSLGPVRPVEIEQLVSAILVLSLAPAELAADSLIAVLDALDDTHICRDDPERCNPLCENLESDCSVCGKDEDCIDRVEEMCHVQLPRRCH